MGHISHLRKQFNTINTYDYIITLINKRKKTLSTSWGFLLSLVEIGQVVLRRTLFFISSMCFRFFVIIFPWKRAGPFIWTNLNFLHPRMRCAKFGWNRPNGSWKENFGISSMYFRYFVVISAWKRARPRPFIWTNLNPLHPRRLCVKFGWNWSSGSGEEDENVKSLRQQRRRRLRRRRTTDKFWS